MNPDQTHTVTKQSRYAIEAMGMPCSECGETPNRLWVYYTMRGNNRRTHNGQFCSGICHNIYHKLIKKPPGGAA